MRKPDFLQSVEQNIQQRGLFQRGQRILIGVSGGVDSMVLLHVLQKLAPRHGWKLFIAHLNHQLRGESSEADERFVRKAAQKWKLPFLSQRADVKAFAEKNKLSVEMAARRLRHDFLARSATRRSATAIALAHHAGDQVELFFLRLLRGAGAQGLTGMKWKSPSPGNSKITIVRPLLNLSREAIEQFAKKNEIRFREDETNRSVDFLRNRVRHELVPLLEKHYQPALREIIARVIEVLEAESEFVAEAAADWMENRVEPATRFKRHFDQLPLAVQRRILQTQLFRLGIEPDFDVVEHLRLRPNARLTLTPNVSAHRNSEGLVRTEHVQVVRPTFGATRIGVELTGARGRVQFGRLKISWSIAKMGRYVAPKPTACSESFNADKVGARIALRHWLPGDRFQPIGMPANIKLQDLFSNLKVPRARRHELVVAEAANGELFWVEGLRISERFKLDKTTRRRLNWHWQSY